MRVFFTCACLTVAALGLGTTSAQAYEWHRGRVYYGRPAIVVRPAPIVVGAAPVVVAPAAPVVVAQPPVYGPAYAPAPVVVAPAFRPLISLRLGFGR